MKNIMQLMQKAQQMQKDMETLQNEIKSQHFESTSGGGLVKIVMDGSYDIKDIHIDDKIVSLDDKTMMIDLIIAAYNESKRKVKEETDKKMQELTAGLPIPPGMKIPGMF